MSARLQIGALQGGGIVLGYRCPSRCRHCLYACGPHRDDGKPTPAELDELLDRLADRAPRARYHIGGGEPVLDRELLEQAISGLAERGLVLDYVETNAAWVQDDDQARQVLRALRGAGLRQVLVSASPFHAEYIAPGRTLTLIAAAEELLPCGALVWIPEFVELISAGDLRRPIDLEALLERRGQRFALELALAYGLVPGGRAGRFMHSHGMRKPWREVLSDVSCRRRLADTAHFHVDGQGRYVPGLCAGLVLPLERVPGQLDLHDYPLLAALVQGGLTALVRYAQERGFSPDQTYAAGCDLCSHARLYLWRHSGSEQLAELGPPGYYDQRSISGYSG